MKQLISLIIIGVMLYSCKQETKDKAINQTTYDTITTASGLKYFYTKKGNGPKIQAGSKVDTYLSLMVNDSVIWNTNKSPDSTFSFVHENTPLIKGFTEVLSHLKEGDEIVAVLPYTIAYGEHGRGKLIPPKATLIYDQFKVLKVYSPKLSMADSLFTVIKTAGVDKMKTTSEALLKSGDSSTYLLGEHQWIKLWNKLNDAQMNKEALDVLNYYKTDNNRFLWYKVQSLNKLEQYDDGILSLEYLMTIDSSYAKNPEALKILQTMKDKIEL